MRNLPDHFTDPYGSAQVAGVRKGEGADMTMSMSMSDTMNMDTAMDMSGLRSPRTDSFSVHCSPVAFDVVGFNDRRRDDEVLLHVRERLYGILQDAFAASGIPWPTIPREVRPDGMLFRQDRGDGVVVVVPPVIPIASFIDPLVGEISAALRRHNKVSADSSKIRLRMALATGTVHFDSHGMIGHTLTRLFDLLEADVFKSAFGADTYFGLVASDYVYDDVIRHGSGSIEPDLYRPIEVRKDGRSHRAWLYFPPTAGYAGLNLEVAS